MSKQTAEPTEKSEIRNHPKTTATTTRKNIMPDGRLKYYESEKLKWG